jgi:MinD-like ATPase involved in chromosome partitioning or flagellar assembly
MAASITRIASIASGKGGVGKTTVTVNLAWALAESGLKTCLLDADLGLANVDILLGLNPVKTLEHVLFEKLPLEEITLSVRKNLDVIPASSGVSRMAELSRSRRSALLSEFKKLEQYHYILIDNSPGISAQVISFCLSSREIIVVVTPEVTSLTDSYALIKVLKENGLWWNPLLLINRASDPQQAKRIFEKIQGVAQKFLNLNCGYLGYVVEDPQVPLSVKKQASLLELSPSSPAALCFRRIARRLIERCEKKGHDISPEQFWDQSIMLLQQRPRFEMPPEEITPEGPPPIEPVMPAVSEPAEEVERINRLVEELSQISDPSIVEIKLSEIKSALKVLRSRITSVEHGSSQTVMIKPKTGYHVADVLVDGLSVGPLTSYTFTNVTADHTLQALFAPNTYTVTASADQNGTITPSGAVSVTHGSNCAFTITPNPGYHVADVLVDGSSIGPATSYTFANITGDHTIQAFFAINTYTIITKADAGGTVILTGGSAPPGNEPERQHGLDKGKKILIICPDKAMGDVLKEIVETLGYHTVMLHREFERDLKAPSEYHLIIVRWDGPDERLENLLRQLAEVPVLILGNYLWRGRGEQEIKGNVTILTDRPFDVEHLRKLVQRLAR